MLIQGEKGGRRGVGWRWRERKWRWRGRASPNLTSTHFIFMFLQFRMDSAGDYYYYFAHRTKRMTGRRTRSWEPSRDWRVSVTVRRNISHIDWVLNSSILCVLCVGVAPLKPEFSGPKEKIVPIPDGSSFFILGKKNWYFKRQHTIHTNPGHPCHFPLIFIQSSVYELPATTSFTTPTSPTSSSSSSSSAVFHWLLRIPSNPTHSGT